MYFRALLLKERTRKVHVGHRKKIKKLRVRRDFSKMEKIDNFEDVLPQPDSVDGCEGGAHKKRRRGRLTQKNLFQLWGLENPNLDLRPSTATSLASRKNQQRLCPFYKRIPGSTTILVHFSFSTSNHSSANIFFEIKVDNTSVLHEQKICILQAR